MPANPGTNTALERSSEKRLFVKAGYAAGAELDLRIDPDWEPRPDVVASLAIEEPYPTQR